MKEILWLTLTEQITEVWTSIVVYSKHRNTRPGLHILLILCPWLINTSFLRFCPVLKSLYFGNLHRNPMAKYVLPYISSPSGALTAKLHGTNPHLQSEVPWNSAEQRNLDSTLPWSRLAQVHTVHLKLSIMIPKIVATRHLKYGSCD